VRGPEEAFDREDDRRAQVVDHRVGARVVVAGLDGGRGLGERVRDLLAVRVREVAGRDEGSRQGPERRHQRTDLVDSLPRRAEPTGSGRDRGSEPLAQSLQLRRERHCVAQRLRKDPGGRLEGRERRGARAGQAPCRRQRSLQLAQERGQGVEGGRELTVARGGRAQDGVAGGDQILDLGVAGPDGRERPPAIARQPAQGAALAVEDRQQPVARVDRRAEVPEVGVEVGSPAVETGAPALEPDPQVRARALVERAQHLVDRHARLDLALRHRGALGELARRRGARGHLDVGLPEQGLAPDREANVLGHGCVTAAELERGPGRPLPVGQGDDPSHRHA
jgi:hypothetical protein